MRRRRGFTLLEVLAAMLILGTAIVAVLGIQGTSIRNSQRIKELFRANAAAEAALDEFLAKPVFEATADGLIDSQNEVTVEGYSTDEFEIRRILTERIPFDTQETVELYPEEKAAMQAEAEAAAKETGAKAAEAEEEEEEFDPGTFVAIRIEVRRRGEERPLIVLETWIPGPPEEVQK